MQDSDDADWRPGLSQRVARWVMLVAVFAVLLVAVGGTVSILFTR